MPLSPAKAAEIAGVSRSLISKEAKSGNLISTKNNRGHISIEEDDLDDWMSRRTERSSTPKPATAQIQQVTRHEDAERITGLEVKVEMLSGQLDEMRADRARLLDMIEKFSQPKPRWWQRIHRP